MTGTEHSTTFNSNEEDKHNEKWKQINKHTISNIIHSYLTQNIEAGRKYRGKKTPWSSNRAARWFNIKPGLHSSRTECD